MNTARVAEHDVTGEEGLGRLHGGARGRARQGHCKAKVRRGKAATGKRCMMQHHEIQQRVLVTACHRFSRACHANRLARSKSSPWETSLLLAPTDRHHPHNLNAHNKS
jgi:hypothetical protein